VDRSSAVAGRDGAEEAHDPTQPPIVAELGDVEAGEGDGAVGAHQLPVVAGEAVVGVDALVRRKVWPA